MKKTVLIACHILYWIFTVLSVPNIFLIVWFLAAKWEGSHHGPQEKYTVETAYIPSLILVAIGACIFYASYFSLHFFIKRPQRFLWIAAFYVVCTLVVSLPADLISYQAMSVLGPVLYFNVCGFLFRACVEWFKDRKLNAALKKDRDASQLELLKSKIDPHFLFNNLNNIDVFIQEDPQRASDYLKKLSDILRFMLYEAGTAKVPLVKEIEYISKYIDLQKIRTSNIHFVKMEMRGNVINKQIAPMILIHFIENAFKYAANKKIEGAVEVRLDIYERRLTFYCKNHISLTKETELMKNGLGISLLRQKLDLLYKKDYTLVTKEENNWYIVSLDVPLHED